MDKQGKRPVAGNANKVSKKRTTARKGKNSTKSQKSKAEPKNNYAKLIPPTPDSPVRRKIVNALPPGITEEQFRRAHDLPHHMRWENDLTYQLDPPYCTGMCAHLKQYLAKCDRVGAEAADTTWYEAEIKSLEEADAWYSSNNGGSCGTG